MSKNVHNKTGQGAAAMSAAQAQAIAETLLQQALAFHQKGQLTQAQTLYESLLKVHPLSFSGLQSFGNLAYETNRYQMAIALLSRAREINPKSASVHLSIGLALQALERYDEALVSYDKAIALEPNVVEAHNNYGNALLALKRLDEALASYDKAIALKSNSAEAYNGRGVVLGELKQFDKALLSYDIAITLKPDYAESYNNRGALLSAIEKPEDALANYDKAIALNPSYANAYYNSGNTLQKLERLDEALASYNQAIALNPYYPEAYFNRGNALQKLEQLDEALISYDKAIALKPGYLEACSSRGNVLQKLKRPNTDETSPSLPLERKNTVTSHAVIERTSQTVHVCKTPIRPGFERHYSDYRYAPSRIATENIITIDSQTVRVLERFTKPDIVVFENVLSDAECELLIDLSRSRLQRTPTFDADNPTGKGKVSAERTSEGMGFARNENAFINTIEVRLAKLMNVPLENGEDLNILHYATGAEYRPHYDFFAPEDPNSTLYLREGGQRMATFIMYLNDVESGGETIFPEIDFAVAPRKGSGVFFSYCDMNGKLDRLSLHGGAPVTQGEKWIATKWVRQRSWKTGK